VHLVQVQKELDDFESRDLRVVAIGQGTGEEAAGFMQKWGVTFPCFGDPRAVAYDAFGMLRGNWWTIMLRSMLTEPVKSLGLIAQADMTGARLAAADVLRLGGVAIVEKGGGLRFVHRALEPADIPSNQEVFEAVAQL